MTVAYPLVIYADTACPVCSAEMRGLRARDGQDRLQVVDCSAASFSDVQATEAGLDGAQLMALIHARDADGRWLRGVEVFQAAYAAVGFTTFARLLGSRAARPLFEHMYPLVARHRNRLSRLGLPRLLGWLLLRDRP